MHLREILALAQCAQVKARLDLKDVPLQIKPMETTALLPLIFITT